MRSDRGTGTGRVVLVATGAGLLVAAWAGLLITGFPTSSDDGSSLVTDGARHHASPANAVTVTLTVPEGSAEPWCLLSNGALVVWPEGSTYDAAAGEVRDRSGDLLGRVGDSVEGGGMVDESPSSDTLDDVDWAGCTPTHPVLHQYG